jgi:hypothetical protein
MAKYVVFRTWTAPEDGEEVTRSSREVFDTIPEAQDYYLESLRGLWVPLRLPGGRSRRRTARSSTGSTASRSPRRSRSATRWWRSSARWPSAAKR